MSTKSDAEISAADLLEIAVHDFWASRGARGRSVYLQGQLHANESAAMLVLHALVRKLEADPPTNSVRIVPNANPIGWSRYLGSGEGRISRGGANWNRIFADPPEQSGSVDARLARILWNLSAAYDVVIDVHTPDFGWEHLYASAPDKRLLTMDDIPHVLYGAPTVGPFDESHLRLGSRRPAPVSASVTLEVPSHQIPTVSLVNHWSDRLLCEIKAQQESAEPRGHPNYFGAMTDLVPNISGAVVIHCTPGEIISAGERILSVYGRTGEEQIIRAPAQCIPVCFRRATVVEAGYWVCRVISLH
jgi:predicted deacylase